MLKHAVVSELGYPAYLGHHMHQSNNCCTIAKSDQIELFLNWNWTVRHFLKSLD